MTPPRHSQRHDRRPDARAVPLRTALRLAFIESVEDDARRRLGRPLTADELARVLRRYPGDP